MSPASDSQALTGDGVPASALAEADPAALLREDRAAFQRALARHIAAGDHEGVAREAMESARDSGVPQPLIDDIAAGVRATPGMTDPASGQLNARGARRIHDAMMVEAFRAEGGIAVVSADEAAFDLPQLRGYLAPGRPDPPVVQLDVAQAQMAQAVASGQLRLTDVAASTRLDDFVESQLLHFTDEQLANMWVFFPAEGGFSRLFDAEDAQRLRQVFGEAGGPSFGTASAAGGADATGPTGGGSVFSTIQGPMDAVEALGSSESAPPAIEVQRDASGVRFILKLNVEIQRSDAEHAVVPPLLPRHSATDFGRRHRYAAESMAGEAGRAM